MMKWFCGALLILAASLRLSGQEKTAADYFGLFQDNEFTDSASARLYLLKAKSIAESTNDSSMLARVHRGLGWIYSDRRILDRALEEYQLSTDMYESLGDQQGVADGYGNMGIAYEDLFDFKNAVRCYFRSASINEKTIQTSSDKKKVQEARQGLATAYGNLGALYSRMEDCEKALEYHFKSMAIDTELNNEASLVGTYSNIGVAYKCLKDLKNARVYHFKALRLRKKIGDFYNVSNSYANIGILYREENKLDSSLLYTDSACTAALKTGNQLLLASAYFHKAKIYLTKNDLKNAEIFAFRCLEVAYKIHDTERRMYAQKLMGQIYARNGRFNQAYSALSQYLELRDSMEAGDYQKESVRQSVSFEFSKRIMADSLRKVKEDTIKNLEYEQNIRQQRTYLYYGLGALVITAVFSLYMFRANRQKKKINRELEQKNEIIGRQHNEVREQKHIIEEKQKEIIDSINYAKHIQSAILAREEEIKKYFPESFLLYKPKDIVAGDFYFFETTDTHVFYAAADCTGHGVPGALVSVVCSNALMRCVKEFGLTDPGKILDKTRELVVETFRKSGQAVKDGMDISLMSIDLKNLKDLKRFEDPGKQFSNSQILKSSNETSGLSTNIELSWAGANNPLWILDAAGAEINEIRADKQPIGLSEQQNVFTTHQLSLKQGTVIYLFTDGFADQFGGSKGKKLKSKHFQEFLLSVAQQPMSEQGRALDHKFEQWKGALEQADDVCVIGIKL